MGNGRAVLPALVLAVLTPIAARAQSIERSVEVGGGVGIVQTWWTSPLAGGDVRLTVPVAARGDVEVLTAVGASPDRSAGVVGFYGGQYRRLLGRRRTDGGQAFLTFGGIGVFAHTPGYTTVSPPLLGIVGGGFEQRVSRRLSLRVDGQAIVLLFIPVGVRLAGGIAVPIGSATR